MTHVPCKQTAAIALVSILLSGCAVTRWMFEREKDLQVEAVPARVKAAAEREVPGIVLEEAEVEHKRESVTIYDLEGTAGSSHFELLIDATGEVLEVTEKRANTQR